MLAGSFSASPNPQPAGVKRRLPRTVATEPRIGRCFIGGLPRTQYHTVKTCYMPQKATPKLLDLRRFIQNFMRDGSDMGIVVLRLHSVQYLLHAAIGPDWLQEPNGARTYRRVLVVHQCFQHTVADPHIFRHVRLQAV